MWFGGKSGKGIPLTMGIEFNAMVDQDSCCIFTFPGAIVCKFFHDPLHFFVGQDDGFSDAFRLVADSGHQFNFFLRLLKAAVRFFPTRH